MTIKKDETTIRIRKPTHGRLLEMGKKKESFDDVVVRLLDFWDQNNH